MTERLVWLVTGSSRGLGRAIVEGILERGDVVVATARKVAELQSLTEKYADRLLLVALDVTNPEQAQAAVGQAIKRYGRLDVLVNNAGYGLIGAFEEMSPDEFGGQMTTNFGGVVNMCRAVLPTFRSQRSGHIIQISSIGGRRGSAGLSGYAASKFAVEGLSEVLAQEIAPLGIKMTIVEPGGFRTDWAGASMSFATPMESYEPVVGAFKEWIKTYTGTEPGDPAKAAKVLFEISRMEEPPLRLPLGVFAKQFVKEGYMTSLTELDQWSSLIEATEIDGSSDESHTFLALGDKTK
ncbi:SDR family NAD(P)-dependent oxidoreductase [Granulicella sp. WH15]|uniref:SDR family NAD(P)-dependent oxidoreductase n=1 Tax=Granulicella sp. WH15 TaxID=2602070 RepID=UPI0013675C53|nr:SDR family NAD(P)-dependent oxidoreductase [Granulicella sp. WH15]QHN03655.1 SDR family NAD(P)-dependent oxidoreductase [Granulicella sp. WH15]